MTDYPRGYLRKPDGRVREWGDVKVVKEWSTQFGEALPDWLKTANSVDSSTTVAPVSTIVPNTSTSPGYLEVGTGATTAVNDAAVLYGPQAHTSRLLAAHFEVSGLRWNSVYESLTKAQVGIGLRSFGNGNGAAIAQDNGAADATFRTLSGSTTVRDTVVRAWNWDYEGAKRRNVGILVDYSTGEIFLTSGGVENLFGWVRVATGIPAGTMQPMVWIRSAEAVQKKMQLIGVKYTVWPRPVPVG